MRRIYFTTLVILSFYSCGNEEILIYEKDSYLDFYDQITYVQSNISFEDDNMSLVKEDSIFIFGSDSKHIKLNNLESMSLSQMLVSLDLCMNFVSYDPCGTTFESGYFLFYEKEILIKVIGITCSGEMLIEYPLDSENQGVLTDDCRVKLNEILSSLHKRI